MSRLFTEEEYQRVLAQKNDAYAYGNLMKAKLFAADLRIAELEKVLEDVAKLSCRCNVPPFKTCLSCRAEALLGGKK